MLLDRAASAAINTRISPIDSYPTLQSAINAEKTVLLKTFYYSTWRTIVLQ